MLILTQHDIIWNMNKIRLVACDIDNTIIPAGRKSISPYLKSVFEKLKKQGVYIFLNTGRHYTFLQESLFEDLAMDRIGTINGACLVDRSGAVIEKHEISEELMWKIVKLSEEHCFGLGFKFADAIATYVNHQIFVDGYCGGNADYIAKVIDDTKEQKHHLKYGYPLGMFLIGNEDKVRPLMNSIPELCFAWSHHRGFDVFPRNVDKSTALESLLKELGLEWENVIAFGDAGNDTAFIRKAGIGVAMGNAKDDVKKYADYIADTCLQDGVAKMLEELKIVEGDIS